MAARNMAEKDAQREDAVNSRRGGILLVGIGGVWVYAGAARGVVCRSVCCAPVLRANPEKFGNCNRGPLPTFKEARVVGCFGSKS